MGNHVLGANRLVEWLHLERELTMIMSSGSSAPLIQLDY